MSKNAPKIAICGAGLAGVAAAYFLTHRFGCTDVTLIEAGDPLSLTSDKSTEAYRNWWPGPDPSMTAFMNRSIDLIEELARLDRPRLNMNRHGYLFASADPARTESIRLAAETAASHGAGPVRVHTQEGQYQRHIGIDDDLTGVDLITNRSMIQAHFPYLVHETAVVAHVRRAGWLSAQQLGMTMLEAARDKGVRLQRGRLTSIEKSGEKVSHVQIESADGQRSQVPTDRLILSAGPMLKPLAASIGINLPIVAERHLKISINDTDGLVPCDAPMSIWLDPVSLPWSTEEVALLKEDPDTQWLLETLPAGVHCRPHGSGTSASLLGLFTYDNEPVDVQFPLPEDPNYPDVVLRGLSRMIPGLEKYLMQGQRPYVDGGYYIRTRENRPLIGPTPVDGVYISGAYSGFGVMASAAGGELVARHVCGQDLPDYAPAFELTRYQNPAYAEMLENWGEDGQL